jgi:hypothetical protein
MDDSWIDMLYRLKISTEWTSNESTHADATVLVPTVPEMVDTQET